MVVRMIGRVSVAQKPRLWSRVVSREKGAN